jgi:hypothetical protein
MFRIKTDISGEGNAQMSYLYVYVVLSSDDGGGIPSYEDPFKTSCNFFCLSTGMLNFFKKLRHWLEFQTGSNF